MKARRGCVIVGVIVVVCVISFIFAVHWFGWDWTGFGPEATEPKQRAKTLWDWLQLLIIPFVLAFTALLFNLANTHTEQRIASQRYENDQRIALDKQKEDLLQTYLDRMSELLLEKNLATSPSEEVRNKEGRGMETL